MKRVQINNYGLNIWSSVSAAATRAKTPAAGIHLAFSKTPKGFIYFYPDGTKLPKPSTDPKKGIILHFNLSQFHATMELLRSEKPVYIYLTPDGIAGLRTGKEPVGEEEMK